MSYSSFYKHELHDANCLKQREGQSLTTSTKSLQLKYLLKIKNKEFYTTLFCKI